MTQMGNAQTHSAQIVVVGAGIIGLACAHYLKQKNFDVTVIDQGTIGSGCSFGNCGYICPSHIMPLAAPGMIGKGLKSMLTPQSPFRIKPQLRLAFYNWLFQFALRCNNKHVLNTSRHLKNILDFSREEFNFLFEHHPMTAEWKETGLLYVFRSEKGLDNFCKTNDFLTNQFDLPAQLIEGHRLTDFEPTLISGLAGAYLYPNDAHLNPRNFVLSWSKYLKMCGVKFIENCRVDTIQKEKHAIKSLSSSKGEITAEKFVIATGAWSTRFAKQLGTKIPIEPGKGYSVTIPKPHNNLSLPILFPEHSVGLTPLDDLLRIGSMMEFSGYDKHIPEHKIGYLFKTADAFLKEPLQKRKKQIWYGWRPMTWDSLPIIGHVPQLKNTLLATGHNMLGVTLAPATGKLVAELINEEHTSIDVTPYAPNRF